MLQPVPPGFAGRPTAGRIGAPVDGGQDGEAPPPDGSGWQPLDEGELYRLWRDATDDSIGADLTRVRALTPVTHPSHRPLLQFWIHAMEQLEHWLRDR